MRKTLSLNENWLFTRQGQDPCTVQLPHTWNAQDGQSGTSMWRGVGRYEKRLTFTRRICSPFCTWRSVQPLW